MYWTFPALSTIALLRACRLDARCSVTIKDKHLATDDCVFRSVVPAAAEEGVFALPPQRLYPGQVQLARQELLPVCQLAPLLPSRGTRPPSVGTDAPPASHSGHIQSPWPQSQRTPISWNS